MRGDPQPVGHSGVPRTGPDSAAEIPTLREAFGQFLRLFRMIRSYWVPLIQGMFLGLILGLVGMVTPYLSKLLIDEVYPSENLTLMQVIVGGVLAIGVASAIMRGIRGYFTQIVGARLSSATTLMFFNHLQHLPIRFFDDHRIGEIMSRFQDVRSSLGAVSRVLETVLVRGIYLVLVPPVLFLLNWKLAIVALATVPVTALVSTASARLLRTHWKKSAEAHADLNAYQIEVLSHIRMLKTLAIEPHIFRRAAEQIEHALRHRLTASGLGTAIGAANGILRTSGSALTTWFAWTLILRQEMTLGSYIAFTAYIGYLTNPITQIASLFASFQQTAVTLGRMFEYLDLAPEQDPIGAYTPLAPIEAKLSGALRIRDLSFGYSPELRILEGITLDVAAGDVIALVGASGAGKSTLLRLLCRIEEVESGEILFDERVASEIPLPDLRRQIAVVWQDVGLVQGTIWDNLVLGIDAPSKAAAEEAVRICRLERLIAGLPQGYETPIAEWGASLSAGQRQRVAIARALLRDAPILLLDEATSNLDVETEMEILCDLFASVRGRTILFTTHRIANAGLADRVAVLEEGRLVGYGSHGELVRDSELYRQMYATASATDESRRLRVIGNRT